MEGNPVAWVKPYIEALKRRGWVVGKVDDKTLLGGYVLYYLGRGDWRLEVFADSLAARFDFRVGPHTYTLWLARDKCVAMPSIRYDLYQWRYMDDVKKDLETLKKVIEEIESLLTC